jgi:hypothetical protein
VSPRLLLSMSVSDKGFLNPPIRATCSNNYPSQLLYSHMWTFATLTDLIQFSLFFYLCSQCLILHFVISPYTQSHHLHLGLSVSRLPWGLLAKSWYTILLLSILLTRPIHLNLFILINETISKSPYNCISSLLRRLLQKLLILLPLVSL